MKSSRNFRKQITEMLHPFRKTAIADASGKNMTIQEKEKIHPGIISVSTI